ncbi:MAG: M23 family metallopeptidase [Acidobacteria bacterium]|jgi:murein DD-endopeptidase MepM/ murein hydrolase activator NlpD|nr:MAG: M23 family metallopeptidase [Acidobacteriota bacterium]GIU81540.1 MAG: hypothetical protein KatS3mg006_0604 [Pyrinomonadaceae bacterium]
MKKDSYAFLIFYSSRSGIYIRRVEISKNKIKRSVACSAFGLFVLIVIGFINPGFNKVFSQIEVGKSLIDPAFAESHISISQEQFEWGERQLNSGGPVMTRNSESVQSDKDEEIDGELREIVSKLEPEYVPNLWPREDKINNEFGFRSNPFGGRTYEFHEGIDISGERGDSVVAAGGGRVIKAGWQGGYGNLIEIDHGGGLTTRYGHLMKIEVKVGEFVSKGQQIGLVGSTGRSTGPHLHFELRLNDRAINPRKLLPPEIEILPNRE